MAVFSPLVAVNWYEWLVIASLGISFASSILQMIRLVQAGMQFDHAPPSGKVLPAVWYSFTGAMSPVKKESAYLHMPTYVTGIIYHLGTFIAIAVFVWIWFANFFSLILLVPVTGYLVLSAACGTGMLAKRILVRKLRLLSSPDDYISNILVTFFQGVVLLALWISPLKPLCFIMASLLLLWFPVGKLKHALYFFAARYHLGLFFGRRGVWPPGNVNKALRTDNKEP